MARSSSAVDSGVTGCDQEVDDARQDGDARPEDEIAEAPVMGDDDARFGPRRLQDRGVGFARVDSRKVVPGLTQPFDVEGVARSWMEQIGNANSPLYALIRPF